MRCFVVGAGSLCLALASMACLAWAAPPMLYVSTQGNDAWSGTLADPSVDGQDGPFATLERARDTLRAMKGRGEDTAGATVYVRGGEYFLEQTFALDTRDSGAEGAPVRYVAAEGETTILVGGASLTGFEPHEGQIMALDLASIDREGLEFRQLFYDGRRQHLARYPNHDPENPYGGGFLYVHDADPAEPGHQGHSAGSKTRFYFEPGAMTEWERPTDGEVWVFPSLNYWNNILPIESVDHDTGLITLAEQASYVITTGDRYFVRGLMEELDAPGEWYLDREGSILYFWPPGDISKRVSVPVVEDIISISGDPEGDPVQDIEFHGFVIEGCDGDAVTISHALRCTIAACTIRNTGGAGVALSAARDCLLIGNDIYETGRAGITIRSDNRNPTDPDRNVVENNYIHHTGHFFKNSTAVFVMGVGNRVRHNLIHDTPRIAVVYGGNDHVIEYNHLRHTNLETQDSGATYCLGRDWTNRGHVVRYNYIHDDLGYGRHPRSDEWLSPFYTHGIYLDDWSSGQHVYGNIVARAWRTGIMINSGRDNVIENNIIYDCERRQMWYRSWPTDHWMLPNMHQRLLDWPHSHLYPALARHRDAHADSTVSHNTFQRNIISYGRPDSGAYAVSGLDWNTTTHDYNVIWQWDGETDATVERMREHGLDLNSVVADPMFLDPEKGDFRLHPDSPALKLGFKPIPQDRIGPYESHLRASWPIVEAPGAREHPH